MANTRRPTKARRRPQSGGGGSGKWFILVLFLLLLGFSGGIYVYPYVIGYIPTDLDETIRLKRLDPQPAPRVVVKDKVARDAKTPAGVYSVEVSRFEDLESTLGLLDTFTTKGYNPYLFVEAGEAGGIGGYIIRLGYFTTKEKARKFAGKLQREQEMIVRVVKVD